MKIFQVDAFTSEPFKGNPAGVCLLEYAKPDYWMQSLATEMNLSETAFIIREKDMFNLRWFTPKTEVTLCGHATLASVHILWEENILNPNEEVKFITKSGILKANRGVDESWIELDFPARLIEPSENQEILNEVTLNSEVRWDGRLL
ncbi:MAG: PhzF family phenazine biosynthesis isomerase [Desulfosporosinus sp.]|nr:PhzF family phenazine biosynthesis isomerase [Desulfosporosinus sp.]